MSLQNHTCVVFCIQFVDAMAVADLVYDDGPSTNILDTAEHGGTSREAPTMRSDVQELSFITVEPAIGDLHRRFLHEIDLENGFRRFLIKNLEPRWIGKERQGRTRFKFEAGFEIKRPHIASQVRHMGPFRIVQIRGDEELREFTAGLAFRLDEDNRLATALTGDGVQQADKASGECSSANRQCLADCR